VNRAAVAAAVFLPVVAVLAVQADDNDKRAPVTTTTHATTTTTVPELGVDCRTATGHHVRTDPEDGARHGLNCGTDR
jgi:hypothetical protein